jgi:glycosyltransferase involved in cell wall biosynthesis
MSKGGIMDKISVVVPCYNEEQALPLFYGEMEKIRGEMPRVDFEYIFVDDGSSDGTLGILLGLAESDQAVRYVSLSRNFGKESAMYAGLERASGDYAAVMDADLQDPPGLLPQMYGELRCGEYDCVATRRVTRAGEPAVRSFFARGFYRLINKMSPTKIVDGARDYRLMRRGMVNAILALKEYNRFSKGIFSWVGFQTKWLEYENTERVAGETKWSFWKLFRYSLDGIMGFSTAPLALASIFGIIMFLVSVALIAWIIIKTLVWGDPVAGWPAMACIILFVGGIQLFCTGISSQYVAKTYLEVKRRPIYIAKETDEDRKGRSKD